MCGKKIMINDKSRLNGAGSTSRCDLFGLSCKRVVKFIINIVVKHFLANSYLYRFDVISISATKEEQLRNALYKMKDDWKTITLSTSPYKYDLLLLIYIIYGISRKTFYFRSFTVHSISNYWYSTGDGQTN